MFTVKHVDLNGTETIRTAAEVKYLAESNMTPAQTQLINGVVSEVYSDGTIYVMNDAGSTVAKYDMGRAGHTANNQQGLSGLSVYATAAQGSNVGRSIP